MAFDGIYGAANSVDAIAATVQLDGADIDAMSLDRCHDRDSGYPSSGGPIDPVTMFLAIGPSVRVLAKAPPGRYIGPAGD
jgi:hypothetical protein